jgi:hypothetical protein
MREMRSLGLSRAAAAATGGTSRGSRGGGSATANSDMEFGYADWIEERLAADYTSGGRCRSSSNSASNSGNSAPAFVFGSGSSRASTTAAAATGGNSSSTGNAGGFTFGSDSGSSGRRLTVASDQMGTIRPVSVARQAYRGRVADSSNSSNNINSNSSTGSGSRQSTRASSRWTRSSQASDTPAADDDNAAMQLLSRTAVASGASGGSSGGAASSAAAAAGAAAAAAAVMPAAAAAAAAASQAKPDSKGKHNPLNPIIQLQVAQASLQCCLQSAKSTLASSVSVVFHMWISKHAIHTAPLSFSDHSVRRCSL